MSKRVSFDKSVSSKKRRGQPVASPSNPSWHPESSRYNRKDSTLDLALAEEKCCCKNRTPRRQARSASFYILLELIPILLAVLSLSLMVVALPFWLVNEIILRPIALRVRWLLSIWDDEV